MEPFNIKIKYHSNEITLTILPAENNIFKIIYFGGILGAVQLDHEEWYFRPIEEIEAGSLPYYTPGKEGSHIEIELTEFVVEQIGAEISEYLETREVR